MARDSATDYSNYFEQDKSSGNVAYQIRPWYWNDLAVCKDEDGNNIFFTLDVKIDEITMNDGPYVTKGG